MDTLVITREGKQILERYNGQDLDTYDYDLELNHEDIPTEWFNDKLREYHFMNTITWKEIVEYLTKEFKYQF